MLRAPRAPQPVLRRREERRGGADGGHVLRDRGLLQGGAAGCGQGSVGFDWDVPLHFLLSVRNQPPQLLQERRERVAVLAEGCAARRARLPGPRRQRHHGRRLVEDHLEQVTTVGFGIYTQYKQILPRL